MPKSGIDIVKHDHADGAEPLRQLFPWLYVKNGKPIPPGNLAERIVAKFTDPHGNIVEAFSHTTGLLQSEETIYEAAKNHVLVRAEQGLRYNEFMLAPQYHLSGEFAKEAKTNKVQAMVRVINAWVAGIKAAEKIYPRIEANALVGLGRELRPSRAIRILKAIEKSDRRYVVGANLVCDENKFPPERHRETFEYADSAEINFEFHVSEWVRRPKQTPDFYRDLPMLAKNLRFVLDLYRKSRSRTKKRLGHAIALPYDWDLMRIARDYGVGVTGCPGSNLQGKNIPDLEHLAIRELLMFDILWSMEPDDDLFQPNLEEVFAMCDAVYNFLPKEKEKLRLNAWKTRFGNRKPVPIDIRHLV